MSRRSEITGIDWDPPLKNGKILAGTKVAWTIKVKNASDDEAFASNVILSVFVPMTGGRSPDNQKKQDKTGTANPGKETETGPLEIDYTQAAPGESPYDIVATPEGGGEQGTFSSVVLVAAVRKVVAA